MNTPLSELSELPPGVENGDAHNAYNCCGGCELSPELEVQLLHWPTQSVECSQANSTITRHVSLPSELGEIQTPAISSRSDALTFAIVDGSTLTFPSLYLAIRGAVSVRDHCAFRGRPTTIPPLPYPQTVSQHSRSPIMEFNSMGISRKQEWTIQQHVAHMALAISPLHCGCTILLVMRVVRQPG